MESVPISVVPHPGILTQASRSHFSTVHDGLAELIDNSIQACDYNSEVEGRHVRIGCFLSEEHLEGYLTVMDNGEGMDEKTLTEFSKLALDRAARGLTKAPGGKALATSISKFGVGAKQASFYLGSRLRVITKKKVCPSSLPFPFVNLVTSHHPRTAITARMTTR